MTLIKSKELLINTNVTPDEDSQEFFDFWKTEALKCRNGITIDGVFISGFLYWHLNYFKCQIDVQKNGRIERKFTNPYLRDNEWIIDSYIRQGEEEKKGVCILGSRRLAKSVFEASYISHRATFFKGTQNVISGLNDPDIKVITDLVEEALGGLPIAFKKGRIEDNWKRQVTLGEKSASGERSIWSSIPIRNLDGGKNTEALAGLSPFSMVIDEIGKGDWLNCFSAAIPGFATPYGWRTSPLAFGTSGDMNKAKDAKKVFDSPEAYNFIAVALKDEPEMKKSIFIPGHYAHDFPKDDTPLNEYLGISKKDAPNLNKINIQVTNFERAERMINEERIQAAKAEGAEALLKITMYHPKDRHELFLTDSNNNFPIEAIRAHQEYLKNNYEINTVTLERDVNKKIRVIPSNIDIIREFPVKPSSIKDAPIVIYEPPIEGLPEFTYVAGIDAYNENESSDRVNSLGVIYIYKRMHDPTKPFQNSIVASCAIRSKSVRDFVDLCINLLEYYGAVALIERNKTFIESFFYKKKDHLLVDGLPIAKAIKSNTLTGAEKGLPGTTPNQEFYMNKMVEYTKEDLMLEEGKETMGCSRIPDIMLLEEMINYRAKPSSSKGIHDGNYDRCFIKGHRVNTMEGYKDISEVNLNDFVLTHNNKYEKVIELFKNDFSGNLYSIKPLGNNKPILCTENHPFLTASYSKKPHGKNWMKKRDNLDIIQWKKAKDLTYDDYLFIPIDTKLLERDKELTDDALYVLGWYLGDGNISKNGQLRICFQGDQLHIAEYVKSLLEKYDNFSPTFFEAIHHKSGKKFKSFTRKKKPVIKKIPNKYCYHLECTSTWFNSLVSKYIILRKGGEKIIRKELLRQKNLLPLVLGYLEADGCQQYNNSYKNQRVSLTASGVYLTLMYQVRAILLQEGIWCTISPTISKNKLNNKLQLRIDIQDYEGINRIVESSLKFDKVDIKKQKSNIIKKDNGFWVPIKNLMNFPYKGKVYNIEVENDHSYTIDDIATHNCVAFGHALTLATMLDRDNGVEGLEMKPVKENEGWNYSKKVLGSIITPRLKSPFTGQAPKKNNKLPF